MIKKVLLIAAALILAMSCSKNNPTSPNGGGIGTTPQPTPSSFIEQLKTIDIIKAGDQQWDFKTIKEDATGKILTIEAMNGNKSGNLRGLQSYIGNKLYEISQNFKYALSFEIYNGTASDGNGNPQNANSDTLEIKVTFIDKTTGKPVTDPDFKDGFTLKINANAKWAVTPEITQADIEESLHKVGNINLGLNFDFKNLTLTKAPETQYEYYYETTLTVDNSSGKTSDLIQFIENVSKANSTTSYLKISSISINGNDTFYVEFETVSGDKVLSRSKNNTLKLTVVGTDNQKPVFGLRDLNVSISGNPTITTDNSGEDKIADINITTDAPYLSLQATKVEQISGTSIGNLTGIEEFIMGGYNPEYYSKGQIGIDGEIVTALHNMIKDGETIQFKVTFVAICEGYNPKGGLELTINVTKGKSLPEITLDDFKNWMKISGFTFDFNMGEAVLSASSDVTPITALNSIKEGLKLLSKDKIVVKLSGYNSLEDLKWLSTYPTGNADGTLNIFIKAVDGSVFSQELLNNYLSKDGEYYVLRIKVRPNTAWLPDISIEGKGKTADNPLEVNIGDGNTATSTPYTLKTTQGISINYINVSELKEDESHPDAWGIIKNNYSYLFDPQNNSEQKLTISTINANNGIVMNKDIAKDSAQIYKVTLSVNYNYNGMSVREEVDLYVKLIKNYFKTSSYDMHKIIIYALSGTTYNDIYTPINLTISASGATVNIAKGGFSDSGNYFYVASGSETTGNGSISYINGTSGLNSTEVINRLKSEFDKIGLVWSDSKLSFTKKKLMETDSKYTQAEADIQNLAIKDGYIFDTTKPIDQGIIIQLTVYSGFSWDD